MSKKHVRFGVVGAGWISQAAFLPAAKQVKNARVTALITGDAKKAKALRDRYELERTTDYDQLESLFEDDVVDAIYLATPNEKHLDVALRTLKAGKHLLLEKPMAVSEAECRQIIEAADQSGAKLMIAYRLHFDPATLSAIKLVREGKLGDVRFFSSVFGQKVAASNHRAQEGYWAGPVPDMGTYPLNAARNFFQAEPTTVSAVGVKTPGLGFEYHDTVSVTLRFPEERLAQFTVSYATAGVGRYSLVGTEGSLEMQRGFSFEEPLEQIVTVGEKTKHHEFERVDQFAGELHAFCTHVLEGTEPEPNGWEGLADVRVLSAIEEALRTGKPVALEPLPELAGKVRYIDPKQREHFPPSKTPKLIDAAAPGDG